MNITYFFAWYFYIIGQFRELNFDGLKSYHPTIYDHSHQYVHLFFVVDLFLRALAVNLSKTTIFILKHLMFKSYNH